MREVDPGGGFLKKMGVVCGGLGGVAWALAFLLFVQMMAPSASIIPSKVSLKVKFPMPNLSRSLHMGNGHQKALGAEET